MYFLPEVLLKKMKTALRIAFSWIVKKKKKKTHSALQFSDLLQETKDLRGNSPDRNRSGVGEQF